MSSDEFSAISGLSLKDTLILGIKEDVSGNFASEATYNNSSQGGDPGDRNGEGDASGEAKHGYPMGNFTVLIDESRRPSLRDCRKKRGKGWR